MANLRQKSKIALTMITVAMKERAAHDCAPRAVSGRPPTADGASTRWLVRRRSTRWLSEWFHCRRSDQRSSSDGGAHGGSANGSPCQRAKQLGFGPRRGGWLESTGPAMDVGLVSCRKGGAARLSDEASAGAKVGPTGG